MKKAAIFDLDGIIFDNSVRLLKSINIVFKEAGITEATEREVKAQYDFNVIINKRYKEIEDSLYTLKEIKNDIFNIFLSNRFIIYDKIFPYSDIFINEILIPKGYDILYFTGRHDNVIINDSMRSGTEYMLKEYNLFFSSDKLIMKPDRYMNDVKYKEQSLSKITDKYKVVMIFDDLPNVCKFYKTKFRDTDTKVYTITNTYSTQNFLDILDIEDIFSSFYRLYLLKKD